MKFLILCLRPKIVICDFLCEIIPSKAFVTYFALEGLLTGMCTLVILQYMFVSKTSVACFAGKDFILAIVLTSLTIIGRRSGIGPG